MLLFRFTLYCNTHSCCQASAGESSTTGERGGGVVPGVVERKLPREFRAKVVTVRDLKAGERARQHHVRGCATLALAQIELADRNTRALVLLRQKLVLVTACHLASNSLCGAFVDIHERTALEEVGERGVQLAVLAAEHLEGQIEELRAADEVERKHVEELEEVHPRRLRQLLADFVEDVGLVLEGWLHGSVFVFKITYILFGGTLML